MITVCRIHSYMQSCADLNLIPNLCQELTRWKNRRRSTSQELIKKEEERKRMEKRMKDEGSDSNKRKSIKTYKEIVEDK